MPVKKKRGVHTPKSPLNPDICPRCGIDRIGFPALSRYDNKTDICSACGTDEALTQFFDGRTLPGPDQWPVQRKYAVPINEDA